MEGKPSFSGSLHLLVTESHLPRTAREHDSLENLQQFRGQPVHPPRPHAHGEHVLDVGRAVTDTDADNRHPCLSGSANLPPHAGAVVGVAVVVALDSKQTNVIDAKIVLGAVAPTPIRAHKAEDMIRNQAVDQQLIDKAAEIAAEEAKPISDIRSPANYRKEMVRVLTAQALQKVTIFN